MFTAYLLLQCLAGVVGWALIESRGHTGPALLEAGLVFLAPLLVAQGAGVPADTLATQAAAGAAFCLINWGWQTLRRS